MPAPHSQRAPLPPPIPIGARAADHLRYIRETMESAAEFAAPAAATKARRANSSLFRGPGRKFVLSFAPPLIVGGLLTLALFQLGAFAALPGVWLLLYGTAIVTGGAFSVRAVPSMGLCLIMLGAAALFAPRAWGNLFMAAGFGLVQIAFGVWIALRYGG